MSEEAVAKYLEGAASCLRVADLMSARRSPERALQALAEADRWIEMARLAALPTERESA